MEDRLAWKAIINSWFK